MLAQICVAYYHIYMSMYHADAYYMKMWELCLGASREIQTQTSDLPLIFVECKCVAMWRVCIYVN